MMNFERIGQCYGLSEIYSASELSGGTASRVWHLKCDSGEYLLRTLPNREQGEQEWRLFAHLRSNDFFDVSTIVPAKSGEPCVEWEGVWYQLQEFVSGAMPHTDSAEMSEQLARLVKRFAAAMSDYPSGPMIHGDFGPWNILRREDGRLMVIDLGEAQTGDPYFDYATLLAGVINHTVPALRKSMCGAFIRELDCDRIHLLDQLRLWSEQGVRDWTGRSETMVSRFINAREWAEEHLHEL